MGTDIHVYLAKKIGREWRNVCLYKKEEETFVPVPVYENRNYDLFDILKEKFHNQVNPYEMPEDIKEIYEEYKKWCFGFTEVTLADLKLEIQTKHKDSYILSAFIQTIDTYLKLTDPYWDGLQSNIKVYWWFDN